MLANLRVWDSLCDSLKVSSLKAKNVDEAFGSGHPPKPTLAIAPKKPSPIPPLSDLLAALNDQDISSSIQYCVSIIDNPPSDFRIISRATQGLVHLSKRRSPLNLFVIIKIFQIISDQHNFGFGPRRFAVQSLGHMACDCSSLKNVISDFLIQMTMRDNESNMHVRKGAFCALSRIVRKFPSMSERVVPTFLKAYYTKVESDEIKWAILIGLGRMSQSDPNLRSECFHLWQDACSNPNFRLRWAGIKGLGHACCRVSGVPRDEALEEKCFEMAMSLFNTAHEIDLSTAGGSYGQKGFKNHKGKKSHKGKKNKKNKNKEKDDDPFKEEPVFLVQYGALQALGLVLRSDVEKWWPRLSPTFVEVLSNVRYAAMVKASVMMTFGKLSFYMKDDDQYLETITKVLFEFSAHPNVLVAEPACFGLVSLCLSKKHLYDRVKTLLCEKLGSSNINDANQDMVFYYLKAWCKLVGKQYMPVLSECKSFVARSESQSGQEGPLAGLQLANEQAIANDPVAFYTFCSRFSNSVIQSTLMIFDNPQLIDNDLFIGNLCRLIDKYHETPQQGISTLESLEFFSVLYDLDPAQKTIAIAFLRDSANLVKMRPQFTKLLMIKSRRDHRSRDYGKTLGKRDRSSFETSSAPPPVPSIEQFKAIHYSQLQSEAYRQQQQIQQHHEVTLQQRQLQQAEQQLQHLLQKQIELQLQQQIEQQLQQQYEKQLQKHLEQQLQQHLEAQLQQQIEQQLQLELKKMLEEQRVKKEMYDLQLQQQIIQQQQIQQQQQQGQLHQQQLQQQLFQQLQNLTPQEQQAVQLALSLGVVGNNSFPQTFGQTPSFPIPNNNPINNSGSVPFSGMGSISPNLGPMPSVYQPTPALSPLDQLAQLLSGNNMPLTMPSTLPAPAPTMMPINMTNQQMAINSSFPPLNFGVQQNNPQIGAVPNVNDLQMLINQGLLPANFLQNPGAFAAPQFDINGQQNMPFNQMPLGNGQPNALDLFNFSLLNPNQMQHQQIQQHQNPQIAPNFSFPQPLPQAQPQYQPPQNPPQFFPNNYPFMPR